MKPMTEAWERQKGESSKSFAWFKVYRDLQGARTFEKVIEEINKMIQNDSFEEEIIELPDIGKLKNQSRRWHWKERCRKYDNYLDGLNRKQKEEAYLQLEEKMINTSEMLVDVVSDNLSELKYSNSNDTSIAHAIASAGKALDSAVKNIRLLYGRSTENREEKVEANVDSEVRNNSEIKLLSEDSFMKQELEFMKELVDEK